MANPKKQLPADARAPTPFKKLTLSAINEQLEEWRKFAPDASPNAITENNSNFYRNMELSSPEGEGQDGASPPQQLEPNNKNTDISPEDPAYTSALKDVWQAIDALPDSLHKEALKSFHVAAAKLPAGEVGRLATTAENKSGKWEGLPKVAPVLWQDRVASQLLPDFLIANYGEFVQGRMDTSHFEILDQACSAAIRRWIKGDNPFPQSIVMAASHTRPLRKSGPK